MKLELLNIEECDLEAYKSDMQQAFRLGAVEGGLPDEEVLPREDIERSLTAEGSIAYKAVCDGEMVGGAIIVLEPDKKRGHLDFLYVKHGIQSKGVGRFIWFEIERLHPEIELWQTCTPYFERRNIHFYVNVCGFHIVEFWNEHHKDPNAPKEYEDMNDDGMFEFQKRIKE